MAAKQTSFFQEQETSEESKVQNHFQGQHPLHFKCWEFMLQEDQHAFLLH